jgi:hypothetical protein
MRAFLIGIFYCLLSINNGASAQAISGGVLSGGVFSGVQVPAFGPTTPYPPYSQVCSSGTTCGVANVTLAAGDVAIVTTSMAGGSGVTGTLILQTGGVTGQTCVPLNNGTQANAGSNGWSDQCWIQSASAVSNATLTVNFQGTNGGGTIEVRRYSPIGGIAPIQLDAINDLTSASSSSLTQVPLNISGTNAVAVQALGSGCNSTSYITAPWTDTNRLSGGGLTPCTADQINVFSVSTPTQTGTAMSGTKGVAFSYNPKSSVQWALNDFNGGSNATLLASTFGTALNGSSALDVKYAVTDASSLISYVGATGDACGNAAHPLHGSIPRFLYSGGATYPNSTIYGLKFSGAAGNNNSNIAFSFPGGGGTITALYQSTVTDSIDFCSTIQNGDAVAPMHFFETAYTSSGNTNPSIAANGVSVYLTCDIAASQCLNGLNAGLAATVPLSPGTWYKISRQSNGNFPLQSPSSPAALSVGSNTITLTSCPFNITNPYYIAGTGTAEFALPISTTCTSGGASGTVTLTVVGTHSAGYTIEAADPITIMDDNANILGMEYYEAGSGFVNISRIGSPGTGYVPSGRALYFANWAFCYAMISPGVCPTTIIP